MVRVKSRVEVSMAGLHADPASCKPFTTNYVTEVCDRPSTSFALHYNGLRPSNGQPLDKC